MKPESSWYQNQTKNITKQKVQTRIPLETQIQKSKQILANHIQQYVKKDNSS